MSSGFEVSHHWISGHCTGDDDMRTVGISVRENVLALFSVLTTLFNSLEFGHIVNLGLLEGSWASFMMLVFVLVGSVSRAFSSRLLHPVDEK